MSRAIWLCPKCGWRRTAYGDDAIDFVLAHERSRHRGETWAGLRSIDAYGRITGGQRSRQS